MQHHHTNNVWHTLLPSFIVGLGASFYLYEYFLRVMPTMLTQELSTEFAIGTSDLGQLLACFFYAYAAMQIPAGLICDQVGPKKSLVIAVATCAIATLLFQATTDFRTAEMTRLAIGAASAFAFVAPLKLASTWFSAKRQALITGLVQMMGCAGAIFAGAPIAMLVHAYGWRPTLYGTGMIGIVLTLLCYAFLRDRPQAAPAPTKIACNALQATWHRFSTVLSCPQSWSIGLTAFAIWAPIAVFAESWGVSYLQLLQGISKEQAASQIMWVWIAMAISSPLAGWLSNHVKRRKSLTLFLLTIGLLASSVLIACPPNNYYGICALLFLLGVASSGQPVTFGMVHDTNSDKTLGTAISLNNMLLISSCSLLQPLVGYLMETIEPGLSLPTQVATYQTAFLVVPISISIGIVICCLSTRETYCTRNVASNAATQPEHFSAEPHAI